MSEEISEKKEISPNIIVPNKDFLIGSLFGFNAARKRLEKDPKPFLYSGKEATNEDFYLGSWLELTCKCGMFYSFDDANQIPSENLKCKCGNIVIFYNVFDPKFWRIGEIKFV